MRFDHVVQASALDNIDAYQAVVKRYFDRHFKQTPLPQEGSAEYRKLMAILRKLEISPDFLRDADPHVLASFTTVPFVHDLNRVSQALTDFVEENQNLVTTSNVATPDDVTLESGETLLDPEPVTRGLFYRIDDLIEKHALEQHLKTALGFTQKTTQQLAGGLNLDSLKSYNPKSQPIYEALLKTIMGVMSGQKTDFIAPAQAAMTVALILLKAVLPEKWSAIVSKAVFLLGPTLLGFSKAIETYKTFRTFFKETTKAPHRSPFESKPRVWDRRFDLSPPHNNQKQQGLSSLEG